MARHRTNPSPPESPQDTSGRHAIKITTFKFILNLVGAKTPIKRSDIVKFCLQGDNNAFDPIMNTVKVWLQEIYGYTLHELREEKVKTYICISKFSSASEAELSAEQRKHIKLLFIALSYIYMKGDVVLEGGLFAFLRKVGLEIDDDDYFGNVKKLFNETFPKQLYLKREKVELGAGGNAETFSYKWGPRADLEFSKKDILDNVAEIMEKPAFLFVKQHFEVYGDGRNGNNDEDVTMDEEE